LSPERQLRAGARVFKPFLRRLGASPLALALRRRSVRAPGVACGAGASPLGEASAPQAGTPTTRPGRRRSAVEPPSRPAATRT